MAAAAGVMAITAVLVFAGGAIHMGQTVVLMMPNIPVVLAHIRGGRLRALGVRLQTSQGRLLAKVPIEGEWQTKLLGFIPWTKEVRGEVLLWGTPTIERGGVRLMVHENWRWQPWYREALRLIQSRAIGSLRHLSFGDRFSAVGSIGRATV